MGEHPKPQIRGLDHRLGLAVSLQFSHEEPDLLAQLHEPKKSLSIWAPAWLMMVPWFTI